MHAMPSSPAFDDPGGKGTDCTRHIRPSHDSANGRTPAERAPKYAVGTVWRPTAMHELGPVQATEVKNVSPAPGADDGGLGASESPVDVRANGTCAP